MTEQEAAAFAERLEKVWGPAFEAPEWSLQPEGLEWQMMITPNVNVTFNETRINLTGCDADRFINGYLNYYWSLKRFLIHTPKKEPEFARFAAEWLPFFRRGCWLSGCDVEASAHEKAEWMQGFTREELEAWNLKM